MNFCKISEFVGCVWCCDDDGAEKFRTLDDDVDDELLINACGVSTVFFNASGCSDSCGDGGGDGGFLDLVASLYSAALFLNTTDCHC